MYRRVTRLNGCKIWEGVSRITAFLQIKEFQAQFPPPLPPISSGLLLLSGGPAQRFQCKPVKANGPFRRHTLSAPLVPPDTFCFHFTHRTLKTCFWAMCPKAYTCFTQLWHHRLSWYHTHSQDKINWAQGEEGRWVGTLRSQYKGKVLDCRAA